MRTVWIWSSICISIIILFFVDFVINLESIELSLILFTSQGHEGDCDEFPTANFHVRHFRVCRLFSAKSWEPLEDLGDAFSVDLIRVFGTSKDILEGVSVESVIGNEYVSWPVSWV